MKFSIKIEYNFNDIITKTSLIFFPETRLVSHVIYYLSNLEISVFILMSRAIF